MTVGTGKNPVVTPIEMVQRRVVGAFSVPPVLGDSSRCGCQTGPRPGRGPERRNDSGGRGCPWRRWHRRQCLGKAQGSRFRGRSSARSRALTHCSPAVRSLSSGRPGRAEVGGGVGVRGVQSWSFSPGAAAPPSPQFPSTRTSCPAPRDWGGSPRGTHPCNGGCTERTSGAGTATLTTGSVSFGGRAPSRGIAAGDRAWHRNGGGGRVRVPPDGSLCTLLGASVVW